MAKATSQTSGKTKATPKAEKNGSKNGFIYQVRDQKKKDIMQWTLEKHGLVGLFTLANVTQLKAEADQQIKEFQAKKNLVVAAIKNVEMNHPDVVKILKKLRPLQQQAVIIWAVETNNLHKVSLEVSKATSIRDRLIAEETEVKRQLGL